MNTIASLILGDGHFLKCWPTFFDALWSGEKTFDIRLNDRDIKVGDWTNQYEFDPATGQISGRVIRAQVAYMVTDKELPGLAPGYVCMQLKDMQNMVVHLTPMVTDEDATHEDTK